MGHTFYHSMIEAYRRVPHGLRLRVSLLGASALLCCYPGLIALGTTWSDRDQTSYVFLVPVLTLYWIWHDREKLRRISLIPSPIAGTILLSFALLVFMLGFAGGLLLVQELAMIILVAAIVLLLLGARIFWKTALPLTYLVLTIPVLDAVNARLQHPLQMLAASAAEHVLHLMGIPVFRAGTFLELPNRTLEVAPGCSGVGLLVSTVVLCVPFTFLMRTTRLRRAIFFVCALIIALAANPARVALAAVWAFKGGDVHGPSHLLHGSVIYFITMLLLFGTAVALANKKQTKKADRQTLRTNHSEIDFGRMARTCSIGAALFVSASIVMHLFGPVPVPLERNLSEFPRGIDKWTSVEVAVGQTGVIRNADAVLSRIYRNQAGAEVTLAISYVARQQHGRKLVSSYEPSEDRESRSGSVVTRSWYRINNKTITGKYHAAAEIALNGLFHRKANGAFIQVSGVSAEAVSGFADALAPVVAECLP